MSIEQTPTPAGPATLWREGAIPSAVRHLQGSGPHLAALIERVGPCALAPSHADDPFAALCESIIYQQLAGKAAAAISSRYRALFGNRHPTPSELLDASEDFLRRGGLSGPKIRALQNLARAVAGGGLALEALPSLADAEVHRRLTQVKGIGPWTADMHLIFHLGRADVLPGGDLGVRKAVGRLVECEGLPSAEEVQSIGVRWRPFRTVATWYLWRSLGAIAIG